MIGDILQPTHLLFILVIALLVLGPKRLPEVGRSLGRGLRDFRNALSGEEPDRHEEIVGQSVATHPVVSEPAPEPAQTAPAPAPAESAPAQTVPADSAHTQPTIAEPEPAAAQSAPAQTSTEV